MTPTRGARWFLVGAVLAAVATLILVMAVQLARSDRTDVTDLEVGDCFVIEADPDGTVAPVDVIDCDEQHDAEVVAVADLNPDGSSPYPDDEELFELADSACSDIELDPRFAILPIAPTRPTWDARSGRTVCLAVAYGPELVIGRFGAPPAG
jgi:hypothetical protein